VARDSSVYGDEMTLTSTDSESLAQKFLAIQGFARTLLDAASKAEALSLGRAIERVETYANYIDAVLASVYTELERMKRGEG
jgi:hypothetical protein